MRLIWYEKAWQDYLYWQATDKKILKKINTLIKDIDRQDGKGLGKPEMLKGDLSGLCSKRIDETHRLVYRIVNNCIEIASCRGHYD